MPIGAFAHRSSTSKELSTGEHSPSCLAFCRRFKKFKYITLTIVIYQSFFRINTLKYSGLQIILDQHSSRQEVQLLVGNTRKFEIFNFNFLTYSVLPYLI